MNDIALESKLACLGLTEKGRVATSFDLSKHEGRIAAFNSMQCRSATWEEMEGEKFMVEHVTIHKVTTTSMQNGEIIELDRTVLVAPDGMLVSTSSPYVIEALAKVYGIYGPPPWAPPITIVPRLLTSKKGLTFKTFELA